MMKGFSGLVLFLFFCTQLFSQKQCESSRNYNAEIIADPLRMQQYKTIEEFTNRFINEQNSTQQARVNSNDIIKSPVVFHVLYHYPENKVGDEIIRAQIERLNKDFRRRNADTSLTPAAFKRIAADCEIEFYLATSDPARYSTTGIIKKYTPVKDWDSRSYKMMSDAEYGSSPWDTKSYLNIWVCVMTGAAGFSSSPGSVATRDGIVIDYGSFGTIGYNGGYDMGRTLVHEVGHWLGLKHIWGDANCGDDGVSDTPKQETYTVGCPTGNKSSCNNGTAGDMFMNYMDFTDDACMNLFTTGQKNKMRSLFAAGGARASMLASKGLAAPLFITRPIEIPDPTWLYTKIYPNPATNKLLLNMEYDARWIGKTINVTNMAGQSVMRVVITSKQLEINVSWLQAGTYILSAQKEDGETIREKFYKM